MDRATVIAHLESGTHEDRLALGRAHVDEAVWLELIAQAPDLRFGITSVAGLGERVHVVLAKDPDARVRARMCARRDLHEQAWRLLLTDADEGNRLLLACNAKAPDWALDVLAHDAWSEVRETVERRRRG